MLTLHQLQFVFNIKLFNKLVNWKYSHIFKNLVGENNTSDTTEDKKVSSEKDVESYDFDDPVEDAVERDSLGEGYSNNVDKKIFNESYLSYISTFQRKKPQSKQRGNILNHFSTGSLRQMI